MNDASTAGRSSFSSPGFVRDYARFRPSPPPALVDLLLQLAQIDRPGLVVDLGAGTGRSSVVWAGRAERIVGIEPNPQMLQAATPAPSLEYVAAWAHATGLAEQCADIVTCAQSFHWMEPGPTIAEVARILKTGGLFATYDYDLVPAVNWEVDAAFADILRRAGVDPDRPEKTVQLDRLRAAGAFGAVREVLIHGLEEGDAERLLGYARSIGAVARRLDIGDSEEDLGLVRLREIATRTNPHRRFQFWWSYRVRVAVKGS